MVIKNKWIKGLIEKREKMIVLFFFVLIAALVVFFASNGVKAEPNNPLNEKAEHVSRMAPNEIDETEIDKLSQLEPDMELIKEMEEAQNLNPSGETPQNASQDGSQEGDKPQEEAETSEDQTPGAQEQAPQPQEKPKTPEGSDNPITDPDAPENPDSPIVKPGDPEDPDHEPEEETVVIDTDLTSHDTHEPAYAFTASAKKGEKVVPVTVVFNGETISGSANQYNVTLVQGANTFVLTADGQSATYQINLVDPRNVVSVDEAGTTLTTKVVQGSGLPGGNEATETFRPVDATGQRLPLGRVRTYLNGELVEWPMNNGDYQITYMFELVPGDNLIRVEILDADKVNVIDVYEYTVTLEEGNPDEVVGTVHFTLEANTVGLGMLAEGDVDLKSGEKADVVLGRFMEENGLEFNNTGGSDHSFYLAAVYGISSEDAQIPEELVAKLKELPNEGGYDPNKYQPGVLGEKDFSNGSGWMYSINGSYPDVGLGYYNLKPGDSVRVRFTLYMGADIGGGKDAFGNDLFWGDY